MPVISERAGAAEWHVNGNRILESARHGANLKHAPLPDWREIEASKLPTCISRRTAAATVYRQRQRASYRALSSCKGAHTPRSVRQCRGPGPRRGRESP